jgi:hypothetical protein
MATNNECLYGILHATRRHSVLTIYQPRGYNNCHCLHTNLTKLPPRKRPPITLPNKAVFNAMLRGGKTVYNHF